MSIIKKIKQLIKKLNSNNYNTGYSDGKRDTLNSIRKKLENKTIK